MSVLELRQIHKTYGQGEHQTRALDDISLAVDEGVLVAVMGPAGSGKSTLLSIAGTLEQPSSGELVIEGTDVASMSREDRACLRRRTIGYVFQDASLLPGLTAVQNVALPMELDGLSAHSARLAGLAVLEALGLGECAGCLPDELSGGERQLVAIARAFAGERRLLLVDEPSPAVGDKGGAPAGPAGIRLVRAACQLGAAAVVVTHDARLASLADRVIVLGNGRIVDDAVPSARARR